MTLVFTDFSAELNVFSFFTFCCKILLVMFFTEGSHATRTTETMQNCTKICFSIVVSYSSDARKWIHCNLFHREAGFVYLNTPSALQAIENLLAKCWQWTRVAKNTWTVARNPKQDRTLSHKNWYFHTQQASRKHWRLFVTYRAK